MLWYKVKAVMIQMIQSWTLDKHLFYRGWIQWYEVQGNTIPWTSFLLMLFIDKWD